jgi:flagellar biosynthesis activator protein FlaF
MTVAQMAYVANSRSGATGRNPRATEYDAFARVTQKLTAERAGGTAGLAMLAAALAENQRLWSVLAEDVALPTNSLPPRLREGIFYLYQFTRQHSRKVLDGEASVEVLVDINTAMMKGLRGDRGAS